MNLIFIVNFFIGLLLITGCNENITNKNMGITKNIPNAVENDLLTYEGTYTRRRHGPTFVDGKTGQLFLLKAISSIEISTEFTKRVDKAQEEAISKGNVDYANIVHIKVRGKLDAPPIHNNPNNYYKGTLNILEIISIKPVKTLIPPDCFKTFVPCSSDGMAPYTSN